MSWRAVNDAEDRAVLPIALGSTARSRCPQFDLLGICWSEPYQRPADGSVPSVPLLVWSPFLPETARNRERIIEIMADQSIDLIGANGMGHDRPGYAATAARYGWPAHISRPARWVHDVAPRARSINLPGSLAGMLEALGAQAQKLDIGKALIRLFCMPGKTGGFADPAAHPDDFKAFIWDYLQADVRGTIAADCLLPELSKPEQEFLLAVEAANDWGVRLDKRLAQGVATIKAAVDASTALEFAEATGGLAPTQTVAFKAWLNARGVPVNGVGADELAAAIAQIQDPNDPARIAMQVRLAAAGASLNKALTVRDHPQPERHGEFIYGKARSRRVISNGLQVQNFPRGTINGLKLEQLDALRELVAAGDLAAITAAGYAPAEAAKQALRGLVRARPGHMLVVSDFGRIEFAVLMHLAGADHLNEADPYVALACTLHKLTPDQVSKELRQQAKGPTLGAGYCLSPQGYLRQFGGTAEEANTTIRAWRTTFAPAVRLWNEIQDASAAAVLSGRPQPFARGLCRFEMRGSSLVCVLPSGEGLYYPHAKATAGERYGRQVVDMTCMVADKAGWVRRTINLPTLVENTCSSIARDLLRDAAVAAEIAWPLSMLVHDEIVLEVPEHLAQIAQHDLEAVMRSPRPWMPEFRPLVESFITRSYRK